MISYIKAKRLNRKASDPKNMPDKVIEAIDLKHGMSIADIGAGGGYYCLRFADIAGKKGKVYAVDKNKRYLDSIRYFANGRGLNNIVTILPERSNINLPDKGLDYIFMRNVTHHLPARAAYFSRLRSYLKSNGQIIIIDYDRKRFWKRSSSHYLPRKTIINEMDEAGYEIFREFDFLPEQNFIIFKPYTY